MTNDLVLLGRPEEALALTDASAPDCAGREMRLMHARALNGLGRHGDALQALAPLTDAQPNFFPAWIATAEAHRGLAGREWIAAAETAIALVPDIKISLFWEARIALDQDRGSEAIAFLEEAVEMHPRFYRGAAHPAYLRRALQTARLRHPRVTSPGLPPLRPVHRDPAPRTQPALTPAHGLLAAPTAPRSRRNRMRR